MPAANGPVRDGSRRPQIAGHEDRGGNPWPCRARRSGESLHARKPAHGQCEAWKLRRGQRLQTLLLLNQGPRTHAQPMQHIVRAGCFRRSLPASRSTQWLNLSRRLTLSVGSLMVHRFRGFDGTGKQENGAWAYRRGCSLNLALGRVKGALEKCQKVHHAPTRENTAMPTLTKQVS